MAEVITGPSTLTIGEVWTITGTGFGAAEGNIGLRVTAPGGVVVGVTLTPVTWSDTSIVVEASVLAGLGVPVTSSNFVCEVSVLAAGSGDGDYNTVTLLPPAGYSSVDVATETWADADHSVFRCAGSTGPFRVAGSYHHQVIYQTTSALSSTIAIDSSGVITTSTSPAVVFDGFSAFLYLHGLTPEFVTASYHWSAEAEMLTRMQWADSAFSSRVFRVKAPQNQSLPFVVLNRITAERESAMGSDPGHVHALFQLSCFGSSSREAKEYADRTRSVLQRYRSPPIEDIFVIDETELYERDTNKFGHAIDLMVHYRE